jgi:hypothetical protein
MDKSLQELRQSSETLRTLDKATIDEAITKKLWLDGEYTEFNREHN